METLIHQKVCKDTSFFNNTKVFQIDFLENQIIRHVRLLRLLRKLDHLEF